MALLTTPYDPERSIGWVTEALKMAAQTKAERERTNQAMIQAAIQDKRRAFEFERTLEFNRAKEAADAERYAFENSPVNIPSFSQPSATVPAPSSMPTTEPDLPQSPAPEMPSETPPVLEPPVETLPEGVTGPVAADPAAAAAEALQNERVAQQRAALPPKQMVKTAETLGLPVKSAGPETGSTDLIGRELSMTPAEAVMQAMQTFKAQGIAPTRKNLNVAIPQILSQVARESSKPAPQDRRKLPDGSYVIGGKQFVKDAKGEFHPASATPGEAVDPSTLDTNPNSPTYNTFVAADGSRVYVGRGTNGAPQVRPYVPKERGFNAQQEADRRGWKVEGDTFVDQSGMHWKAGTQNFYSATPPSAGQKPLTTSEESWLSANGGVIDGVDKIQPILNKGGLNFLSDWNGDKSEINAALEAGKISRDEALMANHWLTEFRKLAGPLPKGKENEALQKRFIESNAKLGVLQQKGGTVQSVIPKQLNDDVLAAKAPNVPQSVREQAQRALSDPAAPEELKAKARRILGVPEPLVANP